jgi:hypothetical protein
MKGRTLIPIVLLVLIAAAIVLLPRLRPQLATSRTQQATLPLDLQKIIPSTWTIVPGQYKACDFDGDGEEEWFIGYQYDKTAQGGGQIGAVIYDAQVNRVPQQPGAQGPYRPAFLVPYKLLPDIYSGKGQGYLGESGIQLVEINPPPADKQPANSKCQAVEIAVAGFSAGGATTRYSVFRWAGTDVGYRGQHFVGNARIEGMGTATVPATSLHTYNRLNDRSVFCAVQEYTRAGELNPADRLKGFQFAETANSYTIDFCFGQPNDPAYPEGVVMALLRGKDPDDAGDLWTPTGKSYLTVEARARLPVELADLSKPTRTYRVLSVTTPGTIEVNPGQGRSETVSRPGTPTATTETWWWGRERAEVTVEFTLPGQAASAARRAIFSLVSLANERVNADVHWRVDSVKVQ